MPGGQINDPFIGKTLFSSVPPSNSLVSVTELEGLFELTQHPLRALDSPRALLPELQRYKDPTRCVALGAEVPGHRQQQLTHTLIMVLLKTHFFTPILDEKSQQNIIELVIRPDRQQLPDEGCGHRRRVSPHVKRVRGQHNSRQWQQSPTLIQAWRQLPNQVWLLTRFFSVSFFC